MLDDLPHSTYPLGPTAALAEAAVALSGLAHDFGHLELAAAIREDAKRRLDDGRVRVVILGEIKHGKSTLINALLGDALLPVGVTPTTGAVVALRVDPLFDPDSGEPARTGTFLVNAVGVRSELDAERFETLARGKDRDEAGRSPELLVDPERLPATLELIDTPGFNDIDRFRAAVSRSELPRADILVLVLDATQVLSRSELGLIRDAIAAVGGLGDSGAQCMLVINRIDLVPEDERGRIVSHIREGLAELIPGELEPFLTDSKAALRRAQGKLDAAASDAPVSDAEAAVGRLRAQLWSLAGRGGEILPARARSALLRHAKLLGYNAAIQARALRLEQAQIAAEIAAVETAMAASARDLAGLRRTLGEAGARIVAASHERCATFRTEVEEAARAQVDKADIHILTQVVPGAIQDAFLEFVRHESERLRLELEELTRELFSTCGELARRRLSDATLPLGFRGPGVYVEPPKIIIEVAMLALGLVGTLIWYLGNTLTGMVMTIASPLTTVILREKTVRDAREQVRTALPGALDQSVAVLRKTVEEVVARHGEALDEHLMLADQALAEQLLESLRSAAHRLSAHEAAATKLRAPATTTPGAPATTKPAPGDANDNDANDDASSGDASSGDDNDSDNNNDSDSDSDAPADAPANADKRDDTEVEAKLERLRERVAAAAVAELDGLERRLEQIVAELTVLALDDPDPVEPESPPVLH